MKRKGIVGIVLIGTLALVSTLPVVGKVVKVRSKRAFDRLVDREFDHAIAMFYYADPDTYQDHKLSDDIDFLKGNFRAASRVPFYKDAEMGFLRVNVARSDLDKVADRYGVNSYPAYLLFRFGQKLGAQRNDYLSSSKIESFIDGTLKDQLKAAVKRKERIRKERRHHHYGGPWYYNYHWPYHGWGYHHWPYHHGYPYGGVGFGLYF